MGGRRRPVRAALLAAWATCLVVAAPAGGQQSSPGVVVDAIVRATCGKRVVLLGELPTHGEARAFDIKSRVVDRLVEECGVTAVLFEAPMYDFLGLARAVAAGTATQAQLDNAIGRFWWTRELAPWRAGLFAAATRRSRPLMIGGLDDQISITSQYARATLPGLIAAASPAARGRECRASVERHLGWTYDDATPFDDREKQRLSECARTAAATAEHQTSIDASDRVMLESFARYAERQRVDGTTGRDASMYRNLEWHLARLPANSRVVVWTATVHAARQRGTWPEMPLGALAAERWGDHVASIGFTATAGSTAMAGRPARPLAAMPPGSLEATVARDTPWMLLDAAALRGRGEIPSRLLGGVRSASWADYFDAVVVIGEEVAPTFDPWK